MTVYVLLGWIDYEGSELLGVFSSEEKATTRADEKYEGLGRKRRDYASDYWYHDVEVRAVTVDA